MNTPTQNVINTLKGKKVLFLENDHSLNNGVDEFERILKSSSIEYKILFGIEDISLQTIIEHINKCDVIVFQTQWVTDISTKLFNYIKSLPEKKIVVEVYINNPTWFYQRQHGSKHDVYIYSVPMYFGEAEKEDETFYKLTDEPYWDYKNKFDK